MKHSQKFQHYNRKLKFRHRIYVMIIVMEYLGWGLSLAVRTGLFMSEFALLNWEIASMVSISVTKSLSLGFEIFTWMSSVRLTPSKQASHFEKHNEFQHYNRKLKLRHRIYILIIISEYFGWGLSLAIRSGLLTPEFALLNWEIAFMASISVMKSFFLGYEILVWMSVVRLTPLMLKPPGESRKDFIWVYPKCRGVNG